MRCCHSLCNFLPRSNEWEVFLRVVFLGWFFPRLPLDIYIIWGYPFEYASCFACILLMMAIGKSSDSLMAVFLIMLLLVAPRILRIGKSSQRQLSSLWSSFFFYVQVSEPQVAIERTKTLYNSTYVLVLISDDFQIEFNFFTIPIGNPILLLMSPSIDACLVTTPQGISKRISLGHYPDTMPE